jgi:hypothetical protein
MASPHEDKENGHVSRRCSAQQKQTESETSELPADSCVNLLVDAMWTEVNKRWLHPIGGAIAERIAKKLLRGLKLEFLHIGPSENSGSSNGLALTIMLKFSMPISFFSNDKPRKNTYVWTVYESPSCCGGSLSCAPFVEDPPRRNAICRSRMPKIRAAWNLRRNSLCREICMRWTYASGIKETEASWRDVARCVVGGVEALTNQHPTFLSTSDSCRVGFRRLMSRLHGELLSWGCPGEVQRSRQQKDPSMKMVRLHQGGDGMLTTLCRNKHPHI